MAYEMTTFSRSDDLFRRANQALADLEELTKKHNQVIFPKIETAESAAKEIERLKGNAVSHEERARGAADEAQKQISAFEKAIKEIIRNGEQTIDKLVEDKLRGFRNQTDTLKKDLEQLANAVKDVTEEVPAILAEIRQTRNDQQNEFKCQLAVFKDQVEGMIRNAKETIERLCEEKIKGLRSQIETLEIRIETSKKDYSSLKELTKANIQVMEKITRWDLVKSNPFMGKLKQP